MNIRNTVLSVIILLTFLQGLAQQKPDIPINTVVERLQKYLGVYPIEKMHMHFDKPYYGVGDTLWFKTYMDHNFVEYIPSTVGYVEIFNSKDSLIQTMRIPLKNGVGEGHWVLNPEYVSQDNYRFRAYTKWMANFDPAFFYNKIVPIGDAINKKLGGTVQYEPSGRGGRTKATIQLRNARGELLGRQRVNWEANDGWDAFSKGRGTTDDMGRLSIDLNIKEEGWLENGRLVVSVDSEGGDRLRTDFSLKKSLWDVDVQFFPEGGELVAGVSKKLAFKAVGTDGKGVHVTGKIIDDKKNEVATLEDFGLGMGYVNFMPQSGASYTAEIDFGSEGVKSYPLPEVVSDKMTLSLADLSDNGIQVSIATSEENFSKVENKPFYIFAQLNGHLIYGAQLTMKNQQQSVLIPTENLPNGLAQVTLMSAQGEPLSERLLMIAREPLLDIAVKSDKSQYSKKDLVNLTIEVDNVPDSILGSYSVSVVDEEKVPYDDNSEHSILSSFLLTADIKGYVEKPNYYFNEENENREQALEALLLTQGFRRFDYSDLIAEKYPQITFLPEHGITLSGTLRMNNGRPVNNGGLHLSIPGGALRKDAYTDPSGRFAFENLSFPDSVEATINARGNDNYRDLVIHMDQTYFPDIDKNNPYWADQTQNIDQQFEKYLANSRNEFRTSVLIDEVTVTARVESKVSSRDFSALSGLSMADHRLEADRLKGCNVLTMCLSTLLTGITYDNQTLKYYVTRNYNMGSRVPVQFFLDGMPIDEPSLNSIMVEDIEAIEIFLKDELGTVRNVYQNDGVVSIMTKKKEKSQARMSLAEIESLLPKTNVLDLQPLGFIKERKFYAPKYDAPAKKNTNDYRTTIFWKPDIEIIGSGNVELEFYNADGNGNYKVIVEGKDAVGNIGRKVYRYKVQ